MRSGIASLLSAVVVVAGCATASFAEDAVLPVQQAALIVPDAAALPESPPVSTVVARIDISDQAMRVYVDDRLAYTFRVSTGRKGYITPVGRYAPQWLSKYHRSRKYNNAPMPWAVFFHEGYAVHGTTEIKRLGKPASHGCVRLHPDNAKLFFQLVQQYGKNNVLITVVR